MCRCVVCGLPCMQCMSVGSVCLCVCACTWVWCGGVCVQIWAGMMNSSQQPPAPSIKAVSLQLVVTKWDRSRGRMDWEFGISRCKLLYLGSINSKVQLYSTGNSIQSPGINHNGKEFLKCNIRVYLQLNHFPVQQNPRDGGAWWAAVYGVAQSWIWLKRLSSSSRN